MKTKLIICIYLIVAVSITTSCSRNEKEIEVYSFSGENEFIMINNGLIIVTDESEELIGGELRFKEDAPSNVNSATTKFFFYNDSVETTVLSNSENIQGKSESMYITPDLGSINSEELFHGDDLELIKKTLSFSLKAELNDGEKIDYTVGLDVKRVY